MSRDVPLVETTVRLDWSDRRHHADELKPCRLGDGPTRGRDSEGRPCHRSCAEQELAAEISLSKDGRVPDERYLPTDTQGVGREDLR
jgi:hypothetical protein